MAMLNDILQSIMSQGSASAVADPEGAKTPDQVGIGSSDKGVLDPLRLMLQGEKAPSDTITKDDGSISTDQSNPFLDAIAKSRANDNKGPGVLRQFLDSIMKPGLTPNTGTVGGNDPTVVPGEGQDAALNPIPMAKQPQRGLQQSAKQLTQNIPLPAPRPDYSMPTALDPQSIEELRMSLLTQAGQMDANNPNGLSGRMNSPNADSDMGQQRNEAMRIEDSVRGYDGVKSARMKGRPNG